jgi:hypothetical protein
MTVDRAALTDLQHDITNAAREGLRDFAQAVLDLAAQNIGVGDPAQDPDPALVLAMSGHITEHDDGLAVAFDAPYAAKQHEDQHLEHPRGGGPKYLERALTTLAPTATQFMASKVSARLAAGLRR